MAPNYLIEKGTVRKRGKKAALVAGTTMRYCEQCGGGVLVPEESEWKKCTPCKRGWK